jgi:alpha-L-fucosidase
MKMTQKWFRHAGIGMFIHWGVYSAIGRGEWVMHQEQMPLDEYDRHIPEFTADKYNPDEWAQLAKLAGMRYMVLTTKHHDGFCLFDTATTNRNAVRQGPKRDLVKEYVAACRRNGLKIGLYFSLPDWSFKGYFDGPDRNPEGWGKYLDTLHEQVRELCANYGKIDLLWYDQMMFDQIGCGTRPITAEDMHSSELNSVVRKLQPDILINDRSLLAEDFYTAEQHFRPPEDPCRLWEACLTMNKHWGYFPADNMYKSAKEIVHTLTGIATNRGNMLLNVGPKPDGTIVGQERERLEALGKWLEVHREAIDDISPNPVSGGSYGCSGMKGDSVYLYVHWWHGTSITIADCPMDFSSGVILGTGQAVDIRRDGKNVKLPDLPVSAPDPLCTVIRLTIKK